MWDLDSATVLSTTVDLDVSNVSISFAFGIADVLLYVISSQVWCVGHGNTGNAT